MSPSRRTATPCRDCGEPTRYADGFCSDACLANHNWAARYPAFNAKGETIYVSVPEKEPR
jgi:hypothetical protein